MARIASATAKLPTSKFHIFLFILSFSTSSDTTSGATEIKVGLIIEGVANINNVDIDGISKEINLRLDMFAQNGSAKKVSVMSNINPGLDPFRTLQRSCSVIDRGLSAIISLTSCASSIPLRYMTTALKVPHTVLPPVTSCPPSVIPGTDEILLSSHYDAVVHMISIIANKRKWSKIVVFFDEFFRDSIANEIKSVILSSRRQTSTVNRKSEALSVVGEKIFDPNRYPDFTKTRLKELQLGGLATDFVVFASQQNSLKLLTLAELVGFSGEYYHWVIGNFNFEPSALFSISNSSNVVAVVRKNSMLVFDKSTQNMVIKRTSTGRQTSIHLDYIQDSILATSLAVQAALAYHPNLDISTEKYQLGCLSDSSKIFPSGIEIRDAFNMFATESLSGKSGKLLLARDQSSIKSLVVSPELDLLSNGPTWHRIYSYIAETKTWKNVTSVDSTNGGFFPPRSNTLKGLTLRIVTIEEEPFIIRTRESQGDVWSGYCIDILEAIRRHNSIDSPFDYEIYPVS